MRILITVPLLVACSSAERPFPKRFAWGTATAGFQVDMGCPTWDAERCDDAHSDWYQYVNDPGIKGTGGLHVTGESVSAGPGMWETFEADVDRMAADHMTHYRMSLEWSRIFPDEAAETASTVDELHAHANAQAIARYHEHLTALRAAGIQPMVTLNHYTLPLWVHDGVACHSAPQDCAANGWVDEQRITRLIALYAGFCAREFGGEVDLWMTQNEPIANVVAGYLLPGEDRSHPPGLSMQGDLARAVFLNEIIGHARMYDAVHGNDTVDADDDGANAQVGVVLNMVALHPHDDGDALDEQAVKNLDYLYHRIWLDALTSGAWDPDLNGAVDETRADLADRLDLIGINYYNRLFVQGLDRPVISGLPLSTFFFDVTLDPYPQGIAEVVPIAAAYDRPIYITENGTPLVETRGPELLDAHLDALRGTIDDGNDVRGYFYWSYVDNYEWNHGMAMRFGLYELDLQSKERRPREVAGRYAEIAEVNALGGE